VRARTVVVLTSRRRVFHIERIHFKVASFPRSAGRRSSRLERRCRSVLLVKLQRLLVRRRIPLSSPRRSLRPRELRHVHEIRDWKFATRRILRGQARPQRSLINKRKIATIRGNGSGPRRSAVFPLRRRASGEGGNRTVGIYGLALLPCSTLGSRKARTASTSALPYYPATTANATIFCGVRARNFHARARARAFLPPRIERMRMARAVFINVLASISSRRVRGC